MDFGPAFTEQHHTIDLREQRAAERVAMLRELAEIGLEMARDLRLKIAEAGPKEAEGLVLAHHRLARAVRLSLALEEKMDQGLAQRQAELAEQERRRAMYAPREPSPEDQRCEQLAERIETDIEAEVHVNRVEEMKEDLHERLDLYAERRDFLKKPFEFWLAMIRSDLRLAGEEDSPEEPQAAVSPLHHASHGPPPPTGEELESDRAAAIPPPSGEGDQPEAGGGGSPGAPDWRGSG